MRHAADEVRADPTALARLADTTLDASIKLGDGWRTAQAAAEDAETGIGRLVAVCEGDVDRLYRVAFAYQQADREAAERARTGLTATARAWTAVVEGHSDGWTLPPEASAGTTVIRVGLPIDHDGDPKTPDIIDPIQPYEYTENGLRDELGAPHRPRY